MNIVVDCRMIMHSGIGTYLKNIIAHIANDNKLTLLGAPEILEQELDNPLVIPFTEKIYSVKEQLKFQKIIPKCDIFWSPHYNVPLFPVKARKRVATIHDTYHLANFETLSLPKKIYSKVIMNAAVKKSNAIITVSDFSKSEIIKYTACPPEKITRIYNGVTDSCADTHTNWINNNYNLPDKYLLFVGNVKPHKNLKRFLQAYILLSAGLRNEYKIVIVGKKDGFITGDDELFNWISSVEGLAENIIFTGYVDEKHLASIYAHAAALVFPSLYEGFGLPPLEAMKNRCVTTVSDIPVMKEVCSNASLYFDPANEQDIAAKITQILNNKSLKNELVAFGSIRATEFSWQKAALQHQQVFNNLFT